MTVEAIRLQNFMAFEDTGWVELRPITLLFGRNSAGKSAIIRALRLLKQGLDAPANASPLVLESRYGVDLGSFRDMVHGHATKELVWFHFRCGGSAVIDALKRHKVLRATSADAQNNVVEFALGYQAHRSDDEEHDPSVVELAGLKIHLVRADREHRVPLFEATRLEPVDAHLPRRRLGCSRQVDTWQMDHVLGGLWVQVQPRFLAGPDSACTYVGRLSLFG